MSFIRTFTVMLVLANAAAAFLGAAGMASVWGGGPASGISENVNQSQSAARGLESGPIGIGDIGGAIVGAAGFIVNVDDVIFAAPNLLLTNGIPNFVVTFVFAPLYVMAAFDLASIIRGVWI